MTREEAIEFGKMWLELQEDYKESNTYEFFKIAIEALKQEPCKDAISRQEVKKIAKEMYLEVANMKLDVSTISDCISYTSSKCREVLENKLQALPSVKQQEPRKRKGHWIEHPHEWGTNWEYSMYECSECNEYTVGDSDFCPNCGADMREEQK